MKVTIYTDGSVKGNPDGPGGYGTILEYIDKKGQVHRKEYSAGYQKTTNNRMEMMAVIAGLETLEQPCTVDVYSDSQYVVKAFNDHWIDGWQKKGWKKSDNKPVLNVDLWKRMLRAMNLHTVTFHWVKGHNGHPENERCDELATAAANGENLLIDEVKTGNKEDPVKKEGFKEEYKRIVRTNANYIKYALVSTAETSNYEVDVFIEDVLKELKNMLKIESNK